MILIYNPSDIVFYFHSMLHSTNISQLSSILLLSFTHQSFSHQHQVMVLHWSLTDSKSPHVFRTLLRILAVLNNAVVWMVSTLPPTSKFSSPFNSHLVTVPNAPIIIGIIVAFMFHSFFFIPKQGLDTYPSFHFLSLLFCGQPGPQSRQFCMFSFLFFSFFFFFFCLLL